MLYRLAANTAAPGFTAELRATPRLGTWLDTSDLTVQQTVDAILSDARPLC
ncbi:hypothetical protein [Nocardia sp. NPDC052566]|uniref:hypothetical protein n=1 Tax=Nocardia sp. NPDC052566 TaxID=3364330 RepID=UPI0037C7A327